jgi:tRNA wybutosine-synthesizing protein 2
VYVLYVPRKLGEKAKDWLVENGLMDKSKHIIQTEEGIEFPVLRLLLDEEITDIDPGDLIRSFTTPDDRSKDRLQDPILNIRNGLESEGFSKEEIVLLPTKWELLGDVLIIKIPDALVEREKMLARAYANELNARVIIKENDKVQGEFRIPDMTIILGEGPETVHKENGIFYELDASRILFSSGNVDERIRMSQLGELTGEVVVDMFCGIGYFTLPIAKYCRPEKIYGCEKNPVSFGYLKKNIDRNGVQDVVTPLLGDNREVSPTGVADRVLMGYVGTTHEFLPRALEILKPIGGFLHYHETCPNELLPQRPVDRITEACKNKDRKLVSHKMKRIKSYAPGITHVVVDAEVR